MSFFIIALKEHQENQLGQLQYHLQNSFALLEESRKKVSLMEATLLEKRRKKANAFPSALDVQKMRDDNRRMEIDIYLMTREIDGFEGGRSKQITSIFGGQCQMFLGDYLDEHFRSVCLLSLPKVTVTNVNRCMASYHGLV